MNSWGRFLGIAGLVLLGFGFIGGAASGSFAEPLIQIHLILGALLTVSFLISAGKDLSSTGKALKGRTARFSYNAIFAIAVFLGLLVAANWFANRYDHRWDLTKEKVYSLSSQSEKVVQGLTSPVKIWALVGIDPQQEERIKELVRMYKQVNPEKVSTELLDPRSKPHLTEKFQLKQGNQIVIEFGEGEKASVTKLDSSTEETITNAIIKLQRSQSKKIYYIQGHDEAGLQDESPAGLKAFSDAVANEHFTLEEILLGQSAKIPDDAAAVILTSPKKKLLAEEKDIIIKYVEAGGHLVMFYDPRTTDDIPAIAAHFGIEVGNDIVIDQVQRLFAAPSLGAQPIAREYGQHSISSALKKNNPTIYNIASTVRKKAGTQEGTYTELVKTSPTSWAETNVDLLFSDQPDAVLDESDIKGPVSLAVAYEKTLTSGTPPAGEEQFKKQSKIVVFGDSDWIINANIGVFSNKDLVLNSLSWLVGEEGGISIRPRSIAESSMMIPRDTFVLILISSFLVPELILLFGLFVWWKRRNLVVV